MLLMLLNAGKHYPPGGPEHPEQLGRSSVEGGLHCRGQGKSNQGEAPCEAGRLLVTCYIVADSILMQYHLMQQHGVCVLCRVLERGMMNQDQHCLR